MRQVYSDPTGIGRKGVAISYLTTQPDGVRRSRSVGSGRVASARYKLISWRKLAIGRRHSRPRYMPACYCVQLAVMPIGF
jgi:hypothetical protein